MRFYVYFYIILFLKPRHLLESEKKNDCVQVQRNVHIGYFLDQQILVRTDPTQTRPDTQHTWNVLCILGIFEYFGYVFDITYILFFLVIQLYFQISCKRFKILKIYFWYFGFSSYISESISDLFRVSEYILGICWIFGYFSSFILF